MVVTTAGIAMEIPMAGISRILVASCSLHTEYTAMLCRIDRDVSNTHYQPGGMASGNEFKSASLSTGETHMNSYGYNSGSDQQQYNNIRFIVPGQYCLQSVQGNTLDKDPARTVVPGPCVRLSYLLLPAEPELRFLLHGFTRMWHYDTCRKCGDFTALLMGGGMRRNVPEDKKADPPV